MIANKNEIVVIAGPGNTRKTGAALRAIISSVMAKLCANEGPLNQVVIVSSETDVQTMLSYMAVLGGFTDWRDMKEAFIKRNHAVDVIHTADLEMATVVKRLEGYVEDQVGGSLDILIDGIESFVDFTDEIQDRLKAIGTEANGNLYITTHAVTPMSFRPVSERCIGKVSIRQGRLVDLADVILVTPKKSGEITAKIYEHKDIAQIGREFTFRTSGITENSDDLKSLNAPQYEWAVGLLSK